MASAPPPEPRSQAQPTMDSHEIELKSGAESIQERSESDNLSSAPHSDEEGRTETPLSSSLVEVDEIEIASRDSSPTPVPRKRDDLVPLHVDEQQSVSSSSSKAIKRRRPSSPPQKPRDRNRERQASPSSSSPSRKHPEEGWDDQTPSTGTVLVYNSGRETERRTVVTSAQAYKATRPAVGGSGWLYSKAFGDENFMAAGRLHIVVGGRKPSKKTCDNTYVFYVIEGAVNVKIHNTSYIVGPDGMFLVPRGNTYFIENISTRTAKLIFTQAREVQASEDPLTMTGPSIVPPVPTPPSTIVLVLGWLLERLIKQFVKYRKVILKWYIKTSFNLGRRLSGPQAYWLYFLIGFFLRGLLRLPGTLSRINVQVIKALPSSSR